MRLAAILISGGLCAAGLVRANDSVTIDDLVRRVQIPLAAISPDGHFAAYLLVRGDPIHDLYEVNVEVSELHMSLTPTLLTSYLLSPSEAFDETEGFKQIGGELRWVSNDTLLFLAKSDGKMQFLAWSPQTRQSRVLTEKHDQIVLDTDKSNSGRLALVSRDFVNRPIAREAAVTDSAWRIRDSYRFYGSFKNPTNGKWVRMQKFVLPLDSPSQIVSEGEATQGWDAVPTERAYRPVREPPDSLKYRLGEMRSPDGALVAAVEGQWIEYKTPDASYMASRIIVERGETSAELVPFTKPIPKRTILGWAPDNKSIYYIEVGARASTINRATVAGKVSVLYRDAGQLEMPGEFYDRKSQALSRDAHTALLVRSTNVIPAELISVDLQAGRVNTVSAPNDVFVKSAQPEVRFYPIEIGGHEVYGRLYLPLHYRKGRRYPLVLTQYYSQPGFYAATGDEVPVLPLLASDIAVFTMQSGQLDRESHDGDFRLELSRVKKPLVAMEWIYRKLVAEGIVDPERVGVTGLSYGAETAMYAYWQSKVFRAVSVATGSWDPCLMLFGGLPYALSLEERGFPISRDDSAMRTWHELAAGLNARASLPPLLVQSPDGEENFTVPTWFELRRAGAPVEWYEYPNEGHVKRSPANKWWVYQRNLDWFRFWLKDEVDSSPEKTEQYQRWGGMRTAWEAAKHAQMPREGLRPCMTNCLTGRSSSD